MSLKFKQKAQLLSEIQKQLATMLAYHDCGFLIRVDPMVYPGVRELLMEGEQGLKSATCWNLACVLSWLQETNEECNTLFMVAPASEAVN